MKRFILTSLCTLGLSLLGAFGANQNRIDFHKEMSTNSNTTSVEQNVTNPIEETVVPNDNINTVEENTSTATTDVNEATPQNVEQKNTEAAVINDAATDNMVNERSKTDSTAIYDLDNAEFKDDDKSESKSTEADADKIPYTEVKNVTNQSTVKKEKEAVIDQKAIKNEQVYIYKNVDLSQCDSANEVVSELQKNGYSNITKGNIQNIKGLEEILNMIQGSGSKNNTQSTPTTKPEPTSKPAPTTKPTPTTKPAPTTKPTPTTVPAPTKKPEATKPTTKPAPTTAPSSNTSNYANEVLRLVNQERANAGLSALTTNSTITSAANKRAQEIVQSFSHTRPNGTSFSTVLKEYGVSYRTSGENIAYGQKSPQEVVTGWMNSPGHRANILNANFNTIGIGVYQKNGTIYWTQLFTN